MTVRDIRTLQRDLKTALSDQQVVDLVHADLVKVFKLLGDQGNASNAASWILEAIALTRDLIATEQLVHARLQRETTLLRELSRKLNGRATLILNQIWPHVAGDMVADVGAGDCRVADLLGRHGKRVTAFDVCDYRATDLIVSPNFMQYDGLRLPCADGIFDTALMANVIHHEKAENHHTLIGQFFRVIRPGGRGIVIETTPCPRPTHAMGHRVECRRTFVIDYIYNRIFHPGSGDIPVPGAYRWKDEWTDLFLAAGFLLPRLQTEFNPSELGFDQPLIPDWHVMYVLDKPLN